MTLTTEQTLARSMGEDELLTAVLDLLVVHGFLAHHTRNSRAGISQGQVGFPDVLAVKPGRCIAAELKSERGKATLNQLDWLEAFRLAGVESYLWRPSHYLSGRIGHVLGELA